MNANLEELVELIAKQTGIRLTREDLRAPRSEVLVSIFEIFVKDWGINMDNLLQVNLLANEMHSDFMDYHGGGGIGIIHLTKLMATIFSHLGVDDFGIFDLIHPKPKRTLRLLAKLSNFSIHCSGFYSKWTEVQEKYSNVRRMREETLEQINDLKVQLNNIITELSSLKAERAAADKEKEEVAPIFDEMSRMKDKALEEYQTLKTEMADVAKMRAEAVENISKYKLSIQDRQAKIIRSPERLRKEFEEGQKEYEDYKTKREELSKVVEDLKKQVETRQEYFSRLQAEFNNLNRCAQLVRNAVEAGANLDVERKGRLEAEAMCHAERKQLETKREQCEMSKHGALIELRATRDKFETLKKDIKDAEAMQENLLSTCNKNVKAISVYEDQINALEIGISAEKKKLEELTEEGTAVANEATRHIAELIKMTDIKNNLNKLPNFDCSQ